jgi:hypothetical protein
MKTQKRCLRPEYFLVLIKNLSLNVAAQPEAEHLLECDHCRQLLVDLVENTAVMNAIERR